ncbi:DUF2975 domain-containing protein [Neobacillus massiliamazoniensis]|uniref:YoaS n=1 Tax=Neobacillus massiliamazoniensis TaxID=1499688 RepID=A0A0U1NS24_9BACI|nr:DUF2975 domain-containing protein [Neobacillus massiliamazoniensis]CRK80859.1 YoaS [Neobacillus massiliamazoniensis]
MKESIVIKMVSGLITLFIVMMLIAFFTIPFLVNWYNELTGEVGAQLVWVNLFLYVTAIPFAVLLVMAKKLCLNILKNTPFSGSTVQALNIISICAFVDFFLYTIGTMTIFQNLLSFTLMIAAFMVGIVSLVLSILAKRAQEIKDENDLTV